jgi:hypothetical protein
VGVGSHRRAPRYTLAMRILVNFMIRDTCRVHCLAEDAMTPISPLITVRDQRLMVRLLRYVGATDANIEEVQTSILRWSRGSVWIELTPGRKNLLRIRPPHSDLLER